MLGKSAIYGKSAERHEKFLDPMEHEKPYSAPSPPHRRSRRENFSPFAVLIANLCDMVKAAMAGCSKCPVAREAVQRLLVVCPGGSRKTR